MEVNVRANSPHEAVLDWGNGARRAAIGAGGIGDKRSEGDGVTPIGNFPIRKVLYRADRIAPPKTRVVSSAIARNDGWCDAPLDLAYNRSAKLPYRASAEALWREDHLYDLIVVLGFNDAPVVPGAGSAIFLHVARPDYGATQGCVAVAMDDLLELVGLVGPNDMVSIRA
jgi:L,D-peptidoglycan transpeptidase YkuD (ErfK/YbiS/YcfS/YnhG family)